MRSAQPLDTTRLYPPLLFLLGFACSFTLILWSSPRCAPQVNAFLRGQPANPGGMPPAALPPTGMYHSGYMYPEYPHMTMGLRPDMAYDTPPHMAYLLPALPHMGLIPNMFGSIAPLGVAFPPHKLTRAEFEAEKRRTQERRANPQDCRGNGRDTRDSRDNRDSRTRDSRDTRDSRGSYGSRGGRDQDRRDERSRPSGSARREREDCDRRRGQYARDKDDFSGKHSMHCDQIDKGEDSRHEYEQSSKQNLDRRERVPSEQHLKHRHRDGRAEVTSSLSGKSRSYSRSETDRSLCKKHKKSSRRHEGGRYRRRGREWG